jgi:hypothetical protein
MKTLFIVVAFGAAVASPAFRRSARLAIVLTFVAQPAPAQLIGGRSEATNCDRQARQAQVAASQQAQALLQRAQLAADEQLIQAAASSAAEGDLALTELHYLDAGELFKQAANLVTLRYCVCDLLWRPAGRLVLPEFLMGPGQSDSLTKFIAERQDM